MKSILLIFLQTIFFFSFSIRTSISYIYKEKNRFRPHLEKHFSGVLYEGDLKVRLNFPLLATDKDSPQFSGLICGYNLYAINHEDNKIPFVVSILNKRTGEAEILLKDDEKLVACHNHTVYNFYITAFDCGTSANSKGVSHGQRSSRKSKLSIEVKAVNKFNPYFVDSSYSLHVEGLINAGQALISLQAKDDDCSSENGEICYYKIDEEMKKIFVVTDKGTLISRIDIKADEESLYFNLTAVAYDCNGRSSKPAKVFIMVYPACQAGLSGIKQNISLNSNQTSIPLSPLATFTSCIPMNDVISVQFMLSLNMNEIEFETGCDRNVKFDEEFSGLCEQRNRDLVQLLPVKSLYDELKQFMFSHGELPSFKVKGQYIFNGVNQVMEVDNRRLIDHNLTLPFSLYFQMRLFSLHRKKATILSKSDYQGFNRQHFSIYVQNCHLTLLLRIESGMKVVLNPAEWHWKLGKNCTSKLFEVLLSVNFLNASLYLNKKLQTPFQVSGDYPMFSSEGPTVWSAGAAWQGKKGRYNHFLHGSLSSFYMYFDNLDDIHTFQCAQHCGEGLGVGIINDTTRSWSSRLELVSDGNDVKKLMKSLREVSYHNNMDDFLPGSREVLLETRIICTSVANVCPYSSPIEISIDVNPPLYPSIILMGSNEIGIKPEALQTDNFHPFHDIYFHVGDRDLSDEQSEPLRNIYLDYCHVNVSGDDQDGIFKFQSISNRQKLSVVLKKLRTGVLLSGKNNLHVYQDALRSISFRIVSEENDKIRFRVQCYSSNGRRRSNIHIINILISNLESDFYPAEIPKINPLISDPDLLPTPIHMIDAPEKSFMIYDNMPFNYRRNPNLISKPKNEGSNMTVLTIGAGIGIVVLLLLLIVIIRFQGCLPEEDEEDQILDEIVTEEIKDMEEIDEDQDPMEWDDSAITITVNPMEVQNQTGKCIGGEYDDVEDDGFMSDHSDIDHSLMKYSSRHEELM